MLECEFCNMSVETKGTSEYSRIPLSSFSAAFLTALFTSLTVTFSSTSTTRSTTLPLGTGTLIAIPSSFPLSSGRTIPTAFAAPVDVGIIFCVALRPLLKSLWVVSASAWSLV